jgi:hypothetical protein
VLSYLMKKIRSGHENSECLDVSSLPKNLKFALYRIKLPAILTPLLCNNTGRDT